jgi:hypothetical protein
MRRRTWADLEGRLWTVGLTPRPRIVRQRRPPSPAAGALADVIRDAAPIWLFLLSLLLLRSCA